ncbi:MAG: hypothetical protein AAB392_00870 [Patescibacteria group bacterium]
METESIILRLIADREQSLATRAHILVSHWWTLSDTERFCWGNDILETAKETKTKGDFSRLAKLVHDQEAKMKGRPTK